MLKILILIFSRERRGHAGDYGPPLSRAILYSIVVAQLKNTIWVDEVMRTSDS
ncbi:MAG: hypothetical protein J07HQW2_00213 [Haloquadratum walsbyi J07HQW2]|uniref:Uncharacterized protein n=1 Tax=Haloquadratum walsbyi J07HQW2 TaxID=1238425 RepID=U1MU03_9EURY|nr:MAG: hypothetical protein J07HQW2_00213 [Haloquadratum walsbyi J07HQW2]